MSGERVAPITAADLPAVGEFLTAHLNPRVRPYAWVRALQVPWRTEQPNHGFLLRREDRVVGAYLAYYSQREVAGETQGFCNLGAWCVIDDARAAGMLLLTRLLRQKGWHFTDFSPSGNVVPVNRRLRFVDLDTTTSLVPNVVLPRGRGARVSGDPAVLAGVLEGDELVAYLDHRDAAAAKHLVLQTPQEHSYVVFRRDTRKGVRAFGSILHVSNPDLFRRESGRVGQHLLTRHGIPATLVEHRVAGGAVRGGRVLATSRPKMFRSPTLAPQQVDYLYSELTCLPW